MPLQEGPDLFPPRGSLPPHLRMHLQNLGLPQEARAYKDWCREHGFVPTVRKGEHRLAAELIAWRRSQSAQCLAQGRTARRPAQTLQRVCEGTLDPAFVAPKLHDACERIATIESDAQRAALAALLRVVAQSDFVLDEHTFGGRALGYFDGLVGLALRHDAWLRAPETFHARSKNRRRRFGALARHLCARYPVPDFLDAAWMRTDEAAEGLRDWFLHLGRGGNLRTMHTPVPVTKRVAHFFCQAPSQVSVEQALRWGQVRALGGSMALARAVIATSLGEDFRHEGFWQSALRFFVAQDELRTADVGPIVDYARQQCLEPLEVVRPNGKVIVQPPPKPNFTFRGRTLPGLLRAVDRWHVQLGRISGGREAWRPTAYGDYEERSGSRDKGTQKIWRIVELNTSKQLAAEGHKLRHCVVTYIAACRSGTCSIWSMTLETANSHRRVQTIEVSQHGTIVQSRGRANRLPSEQIRGVIRRWAAQEGLRIACFV